MGTDIHLFIELSAEDSCFMDSRKIVGVAGGEFYLSRDYRIFSALAGIRADEGFDPKYPKRGLPEVVSWDFISSFYFTVVKDGSAFWNGVECIYESDADRLVSNGKSHYRRGGDGEEKGYMFNPEYHSPSWLYRDEIVCALDHIGLSESKLISECKEIYAIISVMEIYEELFGERSVRAIFCFDN